MAGLDPAKQSGAECAPLSRLLPPAFARVAMTAGVGFASQVDRALEARGESYSSNRKPALIVTW